MGLDKWALNAAKIHLQTIHAVMVEAGFNLGVWDAPWPDLTSVTDVTVLHREATEKPKS